MRRRLALAGALSASLVTLIRLPLSAADGLPDILGIRPGMGIREALAILKQHDSKGLITVGQTAVPQLGAKPIPTMINLRGSEAGLDSVSVQITLPPNEQVVWAVSRQLRFVEGEAVPAATALMSLREKYGPESINTTPRLYWFFDERGGRATDLATLNTQNCAASGWGAPSPTQDPTFNQTVVDAGSPLLGSHFSRPACEALVKIEALLQPSVGVGARRDEVGMMTIAITDSPLATRAKRATDAVIAGADAAKEKEERDKAGQRQVPKL